MARKLAGELPAHVEFRLLGSFAHTLTGHGTDKALVAGMLGFAPDDLRIRARSRTPARRARLHVHPLPDCDDYEHPNTIDTSSTPLRRPHGGARRKRGRRRSRSSARSTRWTSASPVRTTRSWCSSATGRTRAHRHQPFGARRQHRHGPPIPRKQRGDTAWTVLETDQRINDDAQATILKTPDPRRARHPRRRARPSAGCHRGSRAGSGAWRLRALDFTNGAQLPRFAPHRRPPSPRYSCSMKPPCSRQAGMPTARERVPCLCAARHERRHVPAARCTGRIHGRALRRGATGEGARFDRRRARRPHSQRSRLRHGRIGDQCFHGPHRGGPPPPDRPASSPA